MLTRVVVALSAVLCLAAGTVVARQAAADGRGQASPVSGVLERVDARARSIEVAVDGRSMRQVLLLAQDAEIRERARLLTLDELSARVGRRVKVRLRVQEGRPVVRLVTVGPAARQP